MKRLLLAAAATLSLLVACSPAGFAPGPTSTPIPISLTYFPTDTPTPVPEPIYLSIIWQFHQPLYSVDRLTGLITRPWVRINATRYYYGMAATLSRYPKVHETFNFSPVLNQQLDAFAAGARDIDWELSTRPASSLSDADKTDLLRNFFTEADQPTIQRFPRFKELSNKLGGTDEAHLNAAVRSFTEQDIRDLQVLFNLATFDPDLLAAPPLHGLVRKGRDFSEDDKRTVFEAVLGAIRGLAPLYAHLQDTGQVELTTSPFAAPVLPLLLDSNTATQSNTSIRLPSPPFRSEMDAVAQLKRAIESYRKHYGKTPRGLLPTGGAVAQNIAQPVSGAGFSWTVSGEAVLSRSLNLAAAGLDSDVLYRPYELKPASGNPLAVLFRDSQLSNLIPTAYANMDAAKAADDLINRIMQIKADLSRRHATGPHLITLVVDGDTAWNNYGDDGLAFLNALYQRLSDAADRYDIRTVTPSEYLAKYPGQRPLPALAAGTWGSFGATDFSPWIGSAESNAAWSNLTRTRAFLSDYLSGEKTTDPGALASAYSAVLLAEGADCYQPAASHSGQDNSYFDQAFRALLGQVYSNLGVPLPDFLQIPMLPAPVISGDRTLTAPITPTIDGIAGENEWGGAGAVEQAGNGQSSGNVIGAFFYGVNSQNLFFRVDARQDWSAVAANADSPQVLRVAIYLAKPDVASYSDFTRLSGDGDVRVALGMSATHVLEWELNPDGTSSSALYAANNSHGWAGAPTMVPHSAAVGKVLEATVPLNSLGGLPGQTKLKMLVVISSGGKVIATFPGNGVAQLTMPSLGTASGASGRLIGSFDDAVGDDRGPGTYTYPTDAVFVPGSFDLKHATLSIDNQNLTFRIDLNSPLNNVWSSPTGLSIQTIDIYIDTDPGKSSGSRKLLPGRNAVLPAGDGWEYAIWVEGWSQELFRPDSGGKAVAQDSVVVKADVDPTGSVLIAVPLSAFPAGSDPTRWGYAIAVLGQESFPDTGVLRVRDVDSKASQWHFGGAPDDTNHTRIIDVLNPPDGKSGSSSGMSTYPSSQNQDVNSLKPDEFTAVPVVTINQ